MASRKWGSLFLPLVLAGVLGLAADVPPGPVGWWKFDEASGVVAADSSGAGNNGTLMGAAYFTDDPDLGRVLEIAAASGEVVIPHNAVLEPARATIELWIRPDGKQNAEIVQKLTDEYVRSGSYGGEYYVYMLRTVSTGQMFGTIINDDPAEKYRWINLYSSGGLVKWGEWNQLAMRWDGFALALFVNGRLVTATPYLEIPGSGLSYSDEFPLIVGAHRDANPQLEYTGRISDLRIYNRPLSEDEIAAHYNDKATFIAHSRSVRGRKIY